jgi:preprotein translocase subunit YajC
MPRARRRRPVIGGSRAHCFRTARGYKAPSRRQGGSRQHPRSTAIFITPAFAQAAGAAPGGTETIIQYLTLFGPILLIMYFMVLRPQQKRAKDQADLIKNIRRGDTIVTTGGLIGKVTKVVDDAELEVEIAANVRVRVARPMVTEVRAKGEPVKDAG